MLQKKIYLFIALFCAISLSSCGGEDKENNEPTLPEDNKITVDKIEGVWASDDYFISFSSDKFCTSYVAPGFLDCGNFQLSDGVVSCNNTYFNHTTTYTINSVTDSKLNVKVEYTDFRGNSKTENLTLSKTSEFPVEKENPLVGKSYSFLSSSDFGTITFSYSTYYSGQKSASSGSAKKYPLNIFYVWRDGKSYQQLYTNKNQQTPSIGAWTNNADNGDIYIYSFNFSSNGSISSFELLKKIEL